MTDVVNVIGGGLAGVEAAWQAAEQGANVRLYRDAARPADARTPDRQAGRDRLLQFAKNGRARHGTLSIERRAAARRFAGHGGRRGDKVPAGAALSVDRGKFAEYDHRADRGASDIEIVREEVTSTQDAPAAGSGTGGVATIIATGPLTSEALTAEIMRFTGDDQLYFYDAIAPIVAADSIDMSVAFKAARYDKGGDDYINCPMTPEEYADIF